MAAGWVAAAFAAAAGTTLLARRFSGAILASADPAVVVPAAIVGAALVLVADAGVRAGLPIGIAVLARCGGAITAASLLLPPAATTPADWAAVVIAGGLLAAVIVRPPPVPPGRRRPPPAVRRVHERVRRGGTAAPVPSSPGHRAASASAPDFGRESSADDGPVEAAPGEVVRQRLIRRDAADGRESIAGELRISVPVGARLASGHVGFCPSFRHLPAVEVATDYDGVEAVVTVGELLPWGVRIDCRLAEPAEEPLEIPVSFVARAGSES